MIYIVSGIHRSGTSMMMKALQAGGVELFYSGIREERMQTNNRKNYTVNDDFYEVGQGEYMRLGFTTELPDEVAVKIQAIGLPILSACKGYKIIYMRRDPEAIKQSFIKAFSADEFNGKYADWPAHYWNLLDGVKGIMGARRDVELLELWYDDVLADPVGSMQRIAAMGVPIDVDAAASVVDPERCRYAA